jgi:YggT family protein
MILILIKIIQFSAWVVIIAVLADSILSFFMSPWHPVKQFLGRIVQPMLAPIRRFVPPVQMIDFSPVVLIILIQVDEYLLVSILISLR